MGRSSGRARTSLTSGLFLCDLRAWLFGTLLPLLTLSALTCGGQPAPPPESAPPAVSRTLPAIRPGGASPGAEAEAAGLLRQARLALEEDSVARAAELSRRIVEEMPAAPGSSEGLWILARASSRLGEHARAADAAGRFVELLPPGHALSLPARLLEADALAGAGRREEAALAYLSVPGGAPDSLRTRVLEGLRALAPEMSFSELESVVAAIPTGGWERLEAPLVAEYALALHVRDRSEEADARARRALELGADGSVAALARSVLEDDVTVGRRRSALLGAILPRSGSPGEQRYAQLIQEGIRTRLESVRREGTLPTSLEIRDDSGSVRRLPGIVSELGDRNPVGIIGPIGNRALEVAARARPEPVPMVSPTARRVPEDLEAVYSLQGPDPGDAEALARFAVDRGLRTAVVLHARADEFGFKADEFARAYERRGGTVLRRLDYEPGSTFFEGPLRTVRELLPAALVLPVPASDIELLAPQITFFGLDTLGVRVLGTESWGDPGAVQSVEPRHTDGVVLATARVPGGEAPGWERFVRDYETILQQTLRSRVPALGYDAASLLLEAVRRGVRDPEEVREALEGIENFPGATGELSVQDGRIVRRFHLARLRGREMIPVVMDDSRDRVGPQDTTRAPVPDEPDGPAQPDPVDADDPGGGRPADPEDPSPARPGADAPPTWRADDDSID